MLDRLRAAIFAAPLACGPTAPGETTDAGASTSTAGATTAAPASTSPHGTTGEPTTTGPDGSTGELTTTGSDTSTGPDTSTTADTSTAAATTEAGVCVVDPAAGICSEACNHMSDCCKCNSQRVAITAPRDCRIFMGIVEALCPWTIQGIVLDGGEYLHGSSDCAEPGAVWMQYPEDGDRVLELCGETCAAYLDGTFAELWIDNFCHVG